MLNRSAFAPGEKLRSGVSCLECYIGRLAQLVRASALQAEGPRFEPATAHQKIKLYANRQLIGLKLALRLKLRTARICAGFWGGPAMEMLRTWQAGTEPRNSSEEANSSRNVPLQAGATLDDFLRCTVFRRSLYG